MTNYSVDTVPAYIAAAPEKARGHLNEIRKAIRSAVPKAEEAISWGKPYYKDHGVLGGFDAFKNHVTVELWADELEPEHREALEQQGYKTAKRSFRIAYDQKIPTALIKKLMKARADANKRKE